MNTIIVFTDLDGTLLDERYSFAAALPALNLLAEKRIPLVICSSKTRTEIESYRKRLRNNDPFISENGGGIFIPEGYFETVTATMTGHISSERGYETLRLGAPYTALCDAVKRLRQKGFAVKGFGDMTTREIAELTGLPHAEAEMARQRDFDEPFLFDGSAESLQGLVDEIEQMGLFYTRGHFHHIIGKSDKGQAVAIVTELYRKKYGSVLTIALGDSPNDYPMLVKADYPVLVQKIDGTYAEECTGIPLLFKASGAGPRGWNNAVTELLTQVIP